MLQSGKEKNRISGCIQMKKLLGSFVFICLLAIGAVTVQAAPKTAAVTKVYVNKNYDSSKRTMRYSTGGTIVIKGSKKNMKVLDLTCSDETKNVYENYGQLPSGGTGWMIFVNSEPSKKLNFSDFTVTVRVKQDGKETTLKTKCKYEIYKPFSKIVINGKNVVKQFPKGYNTIAMKLAGKKLNASCKLRKGYVGGEIYVLRKGKFLKASAAGELKKGDLVKFEFRKKGWRKSEDFCVIVK